MTRTLSTSPALLFAASAAAAQALPNPDVTKGERIPAGAPTVKPGASSR